MKKTALLTLALTLTASTAFAQQKMGDMDMKDMDMGKHKMGDMKNMEMGGQKATPGAQAAHKGVGVVKELDAKAGKVTFAHEPVKSLNWPAMTMSFSVKDKSLLDQLAVGKKVEFEFVKDGSGYAVTGVK